MKRVDSRRLIACAGGRVDHVCACTIDRLAADPIGDDLCIVLSDWLTPDMLATASLLWVVTSSAMPQQIAFALENRIPLLVPESTVQLKQLCVNANCGLYYRDSAEALECLLFFFERDDLRLLMGANGCRYLKSNPECMCGPHAKYSAASG